MVVSFLKEVTFPEVLLRGLGRGRDPAGAKNQSDKSGDREVCCSGKAQVRVAWDQVPEDSREEPSMPLRWGECLSEIHR